MFVNRRETGLPKLIADYPQLFQALLANDCVQKLAHQLVVEPIVLKVQVTDLIDGYQLRRSF